MKKEKKTDINFILHRRHFVKEWEAFWMKKVAISVPNWAKGVGMKRELLHVDPLKLQRNPNKVKWQGPN